jgi:N4-gp56 family major capsid protein
VATTNFGNLNTNQKTVWSRDVWKAARNASFMNQFSGKGANAMVQRITELTKTEKGTKAVFPLVADLEGDGVMGDNTLEGNEESIAAYDQVIELDQLRNANRSAGKLAEQKVVVGFREQSKDVLGYWLGDRMDQMAFLSLSGVDYRFKNNGALRKGFTHDGTVYARDTSAAGAPAGQALTDLAFAADVTAPTAARHRRWDATAKALVAADTTAVVAGDTPSYAMLVEAKAYAKDNYVRGIKGPNNQEFYHVFMSPRGLAKLKLDPDYLANLRSAGPRGQANSLFSGAVVTQDGLIIHEFRHVFNTAGATAGAAINAGTPGYKWGANADVDGNRILFCGAQALGFADIGMADWNEDNFDYGNQQGIEVGKIAGFKKPVFQSAISGSPQDFGVLCIDAAF